MSMSILGATVLIMPRDTRGIVSANRRAVATAIIAAPVLSPSSAESLRHASKRRRSQDRATKKPQIPAAAATTAH